MNMYNSVTLALVLVIGSDISSTFSIDNKFKHSPDPQQIENTGSITPELPPLVFPVDANVYPIVPPNKTTLEYLQHLKEEKSVPDKSGLTIFRVSDMYVDDIPDEFPSDIANNFKEQVENIQPVDMTRQTVELEERFHQQPSNLRTHDIFSEDIETHPVKLTRGHIAGILAGVLAVLCLCLYAGYLSWRSYIKRRYGRRELLVNQEDYYPHKNSRHMDL